jgi:hypothetical protein
VSPGGGQTELIENPRNHRIGKLIQGLRAAVEVGAGWKDDGTGLQERADIPGVDETPRRFAGDEDEPAALLEKDIRGAKNGGIGDAGSDPTQGAHAARNDGHGVEAGGTAHERDIHGLVAVLMDSRGDSQISEFLSHDLPAVGAQDEVDFVLPRIDLHQQTLEVDSSTCAGARDDESHLDEHSHRLRRCDLGEAMEEAKWFHGGGMRSRAQVHPAAGEKHAGFFRREVLCKTDVTRLQREEYMADEPQPEKIWDEYDWERFLQQQDRKTEKYMELLERYIDHPDRDQIIAREMGWTHLLDDEGERWAEEVEEMFEEEMADLFEDEEEDDDEDEETPEEDFEVHPLYQASFALTVWIDQLFDEREDLQNHPAAVKLSTQSAICSAKLAAALSDDDIDEIGMTIAYLKRALKAISTAMDAALQLRKEVPLEEGRYATLNQRLFQIRDAIIDLMGSYRAEFRRRHGTT